MPHYRLGRRTFLAALLAAAALPPAPARAQASGYAAALNMIRDIARATVDITELFERFTASAYRLEDSVNRRLAEDDLETLYVTIVSLLQVQETMISLWPEFDTLPNERQWLEGRAALAYVHHRVDGAATAVAAYRGAFAFGPEFRALRRAMTLRRVLLRELQRLPRPRTRPALAAVNRIRSEYSTAIGQLHGLAEAIGRYLQSLGRHVTAR